MAKLVQKSGYIKSGKAGGYMRYIATREGVEKPVSYTHLDVYKRQIPLRTVNWPIITTSGLV